MQFITEIFQSELLASLSYEDFKMYQEKHLLPAILAIVIVFFLLGWLISKLFRPSTKAIKHELESISKEFIEDLNTSKEFNSKHQDFSYTEVQDDNQKPESQAPEES